MTPAVCTAPHDKHRPTNFQLQHIKNADRPLRLETNAFNDVTETHVASDIEFVQRLETHVASDIEFVHACAANTPGGHRTRAAV